LDDLPIGDESAQKARGLDLVIRSYHSLHLVEHLRQSLARFSERRNVLPG